MCTALPIAAAVSPALSYRRGNRVVELAKVPRSAMDSINTNGLATFSSDQSGDPGLDGHVPLGMNPGMPVSTTELSLTRVLIS